MSASRSRLAGALVTVTIALFSGAITLSSAASPALAAQSALSQTHA